MKTTLYPNIEAERKRLNLTQEELSKKLLVERKTYYSWINKGNIPIQKLILMGDIFDCSVDYLLGRTRNPQISA
jgi:transcriptional regulator with XRE-family HTH domain